MSEAIKVQNSGDGFRRADTGSKFHGTLPVAKTANYTLKGLDTGKLFTNTGAAGAVALTLPAPKHGMKFFAAVTAAQTFGFTASGGAKINNSGANGTFNAAGTQIGVGNVEVWSDGTNWFVAGVQGTWTTT